MKYFVCSDIHSFYELWQKALKEAGYDKDNENHTLIVCGDIFDRGYEPKEVYEFLKSIPKERRILIRGNHEYLLKDLYERGVVLKHDRHNKTHNTLAYLADQPTEDEISKEAIFSSKIASEYADKYNKMIDKQNNAIFNNPLTDEILKWIFSDEWVNYYELDKYIFVHSFIPLRKESTFKLSGSDIPQYNPNWREDAISLEWEEAIWGCPYRLYFQYFDEEIKKGKVLVCGHWTTADFFQELKGIDEDIYDIYYSNNLIALDGCLAYSGQCNVMVIDEDMKCYNKGKELKEVESKIIDTQEEEVIVE